MAGPYGGGGGGGGGGGEVRCVSLEWDFRQGLLIKTPPVPCLQALRKEKSRNAARSRRGKENLELYELAKMLPLPGAITSQLDKASVVRLTITYLRMRDFAAHGDPPWRLRAEGPAGKGAPGRQSAAALFEQHLGGHILQSLDGFVFALNQEGKFLYISETVSIYLGLSQVELTGSSVFDYVHPGDHSEVLEQLGLGSSPLPRPLGPPSSGSTSSSSSLPEASEAEPGLPAPVPPSALERSFFIRMKSTLTKRGLHVKASGYKVIHVTGRLRPRLPSFSLSRLALGRVLGLVALGHTLPPSTLSEVRIDCHMFVLRVHLDLQIVYCESRVSDYMDLGPSELVGRSCYQFIHGEDVAGIRRSHLDWLDKGQVVTGYYRWLQKAGGFVWLQTCATISSSAKDPGERHGVWVNYVLSHPEGRHTALDVFQLPGTGAPADPSDSESDTQGTSAHWVSTSALGIVEKGAGYSKRRRDVKQEADHGPRGSEDSDSSSPSSSPSPSCRPRPQQGHVNGRQGPGRPCPSEFASVIRARGVKAEAGLWGYGPARPLFAPEAVLTLPAPDGGDKGEPFLPASARDPDPPSSSGDRPAAPFPAPLLCPGYLPLVRPLEVRAATPRLYATSTIRYAPAEMGLALPPTVLPAAMLPARALNLVELGSGEGKGPMGLVYQRLQRLGGAFGPGTADSLFSTLPFSGVGAGPHRKED
ncbi:neuronal PAS domain-containing protein 1 [Ornithorhynchus anatinus]|uniref:neuronal PAS domain-containing protein 1 n=1 Tax=Ornithorhynchus anatinus TaxID=9258 RepID=UPI0019D48606|nr:neuronal PAS domain-containing protein 1 [Ornithorhynchus anatinus]